MAVGRILPPAAATWAGASLPASAVARLASAITPHRLIHCGMWLVCTYTCMHALHLLGFEGPWYRLEDAMSYRIDPPFRHRVLFVLIADLVHAVFPSFHAPRCYLVSQAVAVAAAFTIIKPWAEVFLPTRIAVWSRPLLLVMLTPTFTYWTFYDIGIVFFYTACLLSLVRRRYGWYLVAFLVGTLNHENTLLLVPIALRLRYGGVRDIGWRGVRWTLLQIAGYALVRSVLFLALPVDAAWHSGKVAVNLGLVVQSPATLLKTLVVVGGWAAIMLGSARHMSRKLQPMLLLFPMLFLITIVFGQLNETRLFNAFIPVAIVGVLSSSLALGRRGVTEHTRVRDAEPRRISRVY